MQQTILMDILYQVYAGKLQTLMSAATAVHFRIIINEPPRIVRIGIFMWIAYKDYVASLFF